jgi:hypothetical protein
MCDVLSGGRVGKQKVHCMIHMPNDYQEGQRTKNKVMKPYVKIKKKGGTCFDHIIIHQSQSRRSRGSRAAHHHRIIKTILVVV